MASTITAYSDMSPCPRVRLDIDPADLAVGTTHVTIVQLSKWGEVNVRDWEQRSVASGLVVDDYELPPGVPVTYKVLQFDDGVQTGYAAIELTASVSFPRTHVIIQDPLAPSNAVEVTAEFNFVPALMRKRPTQVYQAGGRTFAMSGVAGAYSQVGLSVITAHEDDREMLAAILAENLILVRAMPETRLPGSFYATTASIPMTPLDAKSGGDWDLWPIEAEQVTRPDLGILVAVYSYQVFKDYLDTLHPPTAGTYADAAATWSTYLDALRNPPAV